MATATVTDFITTTINATATASSTNRATPQGGVFEGENPSKQVFPPSYHILQFVKP